MRSIKPALRATLLGPALLAGCATLPAQAPNPDGLPPGAATLEYLLDQGCFAYLLGRKTEGQAMGDAGLRHHGPLWLPFSPDQFGPFWTGRYPGLASVTVGPGSCSIEMRGGDAADYPAVTRLVLRRRLGAAFDQGQPAYKAVPGLITGCKAGIVYGYNDPHPRPDPLFSIDLLRLNCDLFPIRPDQPRAN